MVRLCTVPLSLLSTLVTSLVWWFQWHFKFYPGACSVIRHVNRTRYGLLGVGGEGTFWVLSPPGNIHIAALGEHFIVCIWYGRVLCLCYTALPLP